MTATLITGVTGQDGTLLAQLLLSRGHAVVGTASPGVSRAVSALLDGVHVEPLDIRDTAGFRNLLHRHSPDNVVNLAATSSVAASWESPARAADVNGAAVVRLLDVLADSPRRFRFLQASSSEVFGPPTRAGERTTEQSAINPASPYAEAKAVADQAVRKARSDGLSAASLYLFGHTSPLQTETFVLPTLSKQAAEVALGRRQTVSLQDPSVARDWGSAGDTVRALADSLEQPPNDLVIGTGRLTSLRHIAGWALAAAGVDGTRVEVSGAPRRPADFGGRVGDASLAHELLAWRPQRSLCAEIGRMVLAWSRVLTSQEPTQPVTPNEVPSGPRMEHQ